MPSEVSLKDNLTIFSSRKFHWRIRDRTNRCQFRDLSKQEKPDRCRTVVDSRIALLKL